MKTLFQKKYSPAEEKAKIGFKRFNLNPIQNYKVDFFYIDFAFPDLMVGIEIDGEKWHTDIEKDIRRELYLKNKGWKIYRFKAKWVVNQNYLPASYIYYKYYDKDKKLQGLALFELLRFGKYYISNVEVNKNINTIEKLLS